MFKFVADNVGGAGTKRKLQGSKTCDTCKRRHKRCHHGEDGKSSVSPTSSAGSPPKLAVLGSIDSRLATSEHVELASNNPAQAPLQSAAAAAAAAPPLPPLPPPVQPEEKSQGSSRSQSEDAQIRFVANLSPESAFIINAQRPAAGVRNISTHGVGLWLGSKADKETRDAPPTRDGPQMDNVADSIVQSLASSGQSLLKALRPALRRECLATIPPEREMTLLTNLFYTKIDPIFPILRDEPWEKHGSMEAVALKQCICLVASLDPEMAPHLRLPNTAGVLSTIEFRARIAAVVKQSLDLGFITNKVVLLQVCTLMSMYVENQGFGELSIHWCAQAVLHEQTLGFHVGWPDGQAGLERSRRLFWCVWVLDRLNAAINGRPTLIHRHDVDPKVLDSVERQPSPFKLLIRIAEFLDHTISLYRPHALVKGATEMTEHSFEELVEATGAQDLPNGLLASLELFYLSVVILHTTNPSSKDRSRTELQWFCAARIVGVASGEFKSSLVFWPLLPHAVTVAASVAYRNLRNSPMSYNRRRAYVLFHDSCAVLDDLSKSFISARAMARLAKDTVQEVERVATERIATERTRRDSIRPTTETANPIESISSPRVAPAISNLIQQPAQPQTEVIPLPGQIYELDFFSGFDGESGVFGNFDPSFDLGRIDAIFSANLDLSVSYFTGSWPEAVQ